jgi:hypothetical protein
MAALSLRGRGATRPLGGFRWAWGRRASRFRYLGGVANRFAVALVVLAVLLAVPGCRPSTPDQRGWQGLTEQAVTDMVSEVATSRLTVRQALQDRFVGRYPVVVLTYSEEAAGTASDSVSTLQPPRGARPSYDALTGLLSDATDAISGARIAVAAGDATQARHAMADLSQVLAKLRVVADRLRPTT